MLIPPPLILPTIPTASSRPSVSMCVPNARGWCLTKYMLQHLGLVSGRRGRGEGEGAMRGT
eukprot:137933-Hanusia_phi.AAC.1